MASRKKKTKARPTNRTARTRTGATPPPPQQAPAPAPAPPAPGGDDPTGLRVRMYRVGFGDFFLLTVPTAAGEEKHILIDCGVHAKDLGTIKDAVAQMAQECKSELALVIVTHRHADHISGFGTCKDIFGKINVERVWMSWFENKKNPAAVNLQQSLSAMAAKVGKNLSLRAGAGGEFALMAENITGAMAASGQVGNDLALNVIHNGFANKPDYYYYQANDTPDLPPDLVAAGLSAQILGPPIDKSLISQMTNKNHQYLAAANESDDDEVKLKPFSTPYNVADPAKEYPKEAFKYYNAKEIAKLVGGNQPDTLAARAVAADNTLNNQSLVVLFSFQGKNLLFAGDAQWGNWENFLYGGAYGTPGHTELTDKAKTVLSSVDFYKVGHHGSTNATPTDAVSKLKHGCVGMCSTQPGAYNQVPRAPLLQALGDTMDGQLARSDQIPAAQNPSGLQVPTPGLPGLPSKFTDPTGALFVDFHF
jgi:beta-lactamase superfamily II metal-dependent hydrolase